MTACAEPRPAPKPVTDRVDQVMRARSIPGLSLAVTDRDGLLFATARGLARLRPSTPATPATPYLWFSMSKLVTATAAVRLAEEGRLDLDAPCEHLGRPSETAPTPRQLLSHTAGMANPLPLRWVHAAAAVPARQPREFLRRRAFRRAPGGPGRYSNLGYLALGEVIEHAAGTSFTNYVRTAVLDPAGMAATSYAHRTERPTATGYVKAPPGIGALLKAALPKGIVDTRHERHIALAPFLVDGAAYGGLVGDVLDAARFARLHLRDGEIDGTRVISTAGAREMRALRHPGKPFTHGLGWFRNLDAEADQPTYVEHYGAGAGYWNAMRLYPDVGLGIVVMANTTAAYDINTIFEAVHMAHA